MNCLLLSKVSLWALHDSLFRVSKVTGSRSHINVNNLSHVSCCYEPMLDTTGKAKRCRHSGSHTKTMYSKTSLNNHLKINTISLLRPHIHNHFSTFTQYFNTLMRPSLNLWSHKHFLQFHWWSFYQGFTVL